MQAVDRCPTADVARQVTSESYRSGSCGYQRAGVVVTREVTRQEEIFDTGSWLCEVFMQYSFRERGILADAEVSPLGAALMIGRCH